MSRLCRLVTVCLVLSREETWLSSTAEGCAACASPSLRQGQHQGVFSRPSRPAPAGMKSNGYAA